MKKKWKQFAALTIFGSALLVGCGNGGSSSGTQGDSDAAESGRTKITWMNMLHTASPPTDTITNEIEEYTNTELEFQWIPDASKEERLNTALASGNLADIVTLTIMENSSVRNALKAGQFWDIEPYLDDYENLSEISEETRRSASIEGVLYGVPFQKPLARNGVIIRRDWLENLGMEEPKTLEELYEVARAFSEDDPNGTGQDDTTGFMDRADLKYGAFKTLATYHGVPNEWKEENGEFTPQFDTPEYIEAMDYMRDLYANDLINQDFAVTAKTDQQEGFAQGRAGIYVGGLMDALNLYTLAEGIQDDMDLAQLNKINKDGSDGYAIWSDNNGIGGLLAFPKSEVQDEEELKAVLQFVNDLHDDEMYQLMTAGIEGVHHEMDGNVSTRIDEDLWQQEVQPFASSRPKEIGYDLVTGNELKHYSDQLILENEEIAILNPAYSLESDTFTSQGSELAVSIDDATYQYILGDIDLDDFETVVESWYNSGGQKIVEEYEAAFAENQ
ncbi:extracellular solute-binding protein [Marinilactibacillus kalidii]|uniref:extracellular solute-binding protein n=1 Tax=Marinilactibacillus kalidii TaxID=2820274 RepID=UPI001FC9F336|nr:extracellular solute-binding protein [Marinilactibacillus kalidii]